MTCFNRKDKTLACLNSLYTNKISKEISIKVYLVDDGSIDGTTEAVTNHFPEVKIIQGNGNLYWAGGTRLAWSNASNGNYDYYVWLNNDVILLENALQILINSSKSCTNRSVICASMKSEYDDNITYGGRKLNANKCMIPNGKLQECDIINGNLVLIPKAIFETIGNMDQKFHHAIGDHDYGLRAIKAGYKCHVAPEILGICNFNPLPPKWCLKEIPLRERVKNLYSPLGYADPLVYFYYINKHFGLYQAVKQYISTHIRVIFPQLWRV